MDKLQAIKNIINKTMIETQAELEKQEEGYLKTFMQGQKTAYNFLLLLIDTVEEEFNKTL